MTKRYCLGVIGGSGLSELGTTTGATSEDMDVVTPYGHPSGAVTRITTDHADILFLPRHGRGHRIPPHRVNYRANVCALKQLGATHLLGVSAVGSLQEDIAPGALVAVNQIIDRTHGRPSSFFDDTGVVAHVAFADPVCPQLHHALGTAMTSAVESRDERCYYRGTLVVINGPRFSTRAESVAFQSMKASVIGMTSMPEAVLAREAELPYAILALVTDYDCWDEEHHAVTADAVATVMRANVAAAQEVIRALTGLLSDPALSPASRALDGAIMTDPRSLPSFGPNRESLRWLRPFAETNGTVPKATGCP